MPLTANAFGEAEGLAVTALYSKGQKFTGSCRFGASE
jgi:hypothetical protein